MHKNIKDITGLKFSRLTAVRFSHCDKGSKAHWQFVCDCGKSHTANGSLVRLGKIKSCGCWNIECNRKGPKQTGIGQLFNQYKQNAKNRRLKFELTREEFVAITSKDCLYCGAIPKQVAKGGPRGCRETEEIGKYLYNGIDRVDNDIGYVLDNCVPCCGHCNIAKASMTQDEFFKLVGEIYNNHKERCNGI